MIIHVLGGGPVDQLPDLQKYDEKEVVWIGVDRGVYTLIAKGIQPAIAFGDFDSVSEKEYAEIQNLVPHIQKFKPEKDETDMELALNWAIDQHPSTIRIFGGTGGRLDHMMANIQLLITPLLQDSKPIHIELVDAKNILYLKKPGIHQIEFLPEKKYISFIPITSEVNGITLHGFKYPLENAYISLGSTRCISNELLNDCGTFSFVNGILMIVRSAD